MHKKTIWMTVSVFMALSLVMAACAPATTPVTPTAPAAPARPATPTPATQTTPSVEKPKQEAPTSEKPQYGGTANILQNTDILNFDPAITSGLVTTAYTQDYITQADWSKGPAGTGEFDFVYSAGLQEQFTGAIAESWQTPGIGTFIFKIRRGIHWALDPASEASRLVNGRELTADDVIYSMKRLAASPRSFFGVYSPDMAKNMTIEKTGPWEVTIKTPVDPWWAFIDFIGGFGISVFAPEVVQKYGDLSNWHNAVGTGAYILKDFVPGSIAVLARNPGYWDTNPVGPGKGDQLPYLDTVQLLIIPDASTRMAALISGKIDHISPVELDDARTLKKTGPQLKYISYIGGSEATTVFGMRIDKPELPFKDKRVRQALMMAIDYKGMVANLYGGEADVLAWPLGWQKSIDAAFVPLEQMPQSVQDLYSYNPTRAKQLLTEAGYPNGFKTKVIVQNTSALVDRVSVIQSMWSKIGVDMELQPKDAGSYNSLANARSFDEMIFRTAQGGLVNMGTWQTFHGNGASNPSYVNDPKVEAAFQEAMKNVIINMPKVFQIYRDLLPYLDEQAYVVPTPLPYVYIFWQPWVRNFHGEAVVRTSGGPWKYAWIDQALKKSLGH